MHEGGSRESTNSTTERRFYIISVLFMQFKGLFLNARKYVTVRLR